VREEQEEKEQSEIVSILCVEAVIEIAPPFSLASVKHPLTSTSSNVRDCVEECSSEENTLDRFPSPPTSLTFDDRREKEPAREVEEKRDPLTKERLEKSQLVTLTANGVDRMKADLPVINLVGASRLKLVSVRLNVPAETRTRENSRGETTVEKREWVNEREEPDDETREVMELPTDTPNEREMRLKRRLPELMTALPLSLSVAVKENTAEVESFDSTVVFVRFS
jgi:hypothetical protein